MNNMKELFKQMQEKYPNHSSFYCFEMCIKGKKMTMDQIIPWFYKLVDKEDYMGCSKVYLLQWLEKYSDGTVDKVFKRIKNGKLEKEEKSVAKNKAKKTPLLRKGGQDKRKVIKR